MPADAPAVPESHGLVVVKNNDQLDAEEKQAAEQRANLNDKQTAMSQLASHIRSCWEAAKSAKAEDIDERLLAAQRQRKGVYSDNILSEIQKTGGSEVFMRITATKCLAGEAWIRDVLAPAGEKPWTLSPTPVPELDPVSESAIVEQTLAFFASLEGQGIEFDPREIYDFASEMRDRWTAELEKEAKKKAMRMERKIEDQLLEGGWERAFREFISDIATFPSGIIKGGVIRKTKQLVWGKDPQTGKTQPLVRDKLMLEFERVSPFDFYPSPECRDPNDGYLIERMRLRRGTIANMRGVEGYNTEAINKVLEEYRAGGLREWTNTDSERADNEDKELFPLSDEPGSLIDALEYHGSASGEMLKDWGYDVEDELAEYDIEAILIGGHVIRAILNPDPLGKRPYYVSSYEKVVDSIWGYGIPEKMADVQQVCNASARALINNLAIASGPQTMVNTDKLAPGEDIEAMYPWKIWQYQEPSGNGAAPISFFQPTANSSELMGVYEKFKDEASEVTGIPNYIYGDPDVGGAGETARGLSMLMDASSRGIKQVIANVDADVFKPAITRLYQHNMLYSDDEDIKGDVNIMARGALALVIKEQLQVQRQNILDRVLSDDRLYELVGERGVAALMRENVKLAKMPTGEIVPSEEELERRAEQAAKQAAMQEELMMQAAMAEQEGQAPVEQAG